MTKTMAIKGLSLLLLQAVAAMPTLDKRDGTQCPTANGQIVSVGSTYYQIACDIDTYQGDMPQPNGANVASFDACIQSCQQRQGCTAASYLAPYCYLKNSQVPRRLSKAGVWSAILTTNTGGSCKSKSTAAQAAAPAAASAPQQAARVFGAVLAPSAAAAPVFGAVLASGAAAAPAAAAATSPAAASPASNYVPQAQVAQAQPSSAATTAASSGSTAPQSGSGGCARPAAKQLFTKRGVAYNDPGVLAAFAGKASWAYNWGSQAGGQIPSGISYVPMLWSPSNGGAQWPSIAAAAIANGADTLLGFNEPDQAGQAQMSVDAAVAGWKQYMEPLKCKARLASPSVTNGGAPMGLTYLKNFIAACTGCTIDVAVIHWYDSASNFAYFKQYVQDAYAAAGNRPIWITEFGASGSETEQAAFFAQALPYLESLPYVERYSYFMASSGILMTASNTLSALGQAYVGA